MYAKEPQSAYGAKIRLYVSLYVKLHMCREYNLQKVLCLNEFDLDIEYNCRI